MQNLRRTGLAQEALPSILVEVRKHGQMPALMSVAAQCQLNRQMPALNRPETRHWPVKGGLGTPWRPKFPRILMGGPQEATAPLHKVLPAATPIHRDDQVNSKSTSVVSLTPGDHTLKTRDSSNPSAGRTAAQLHPQTLPAAVYASRFGRGGKWA